MLTVQFVDNSEKIKELLNKKLLASVGKAAQILSDSYQTGLQASIAPPHSRPGQIPHAYMGHKPGGYGPVNGEGEPNNTPLQGFASTQSDFLSEYIDHGSQEVFGDIEAFVGFRPSHVASRDMNYLIQHDQSGRPWIRPLYDKNKDAMIAAAKDAFKEAK